MKAILKFIKKYSRVIFIVYLLILLLVLVLKFPQMNMFHDIVDGWKTGARSRFVTESQYIPFKTIIEYVKHVHSFDDWFFKNLACNILMFMPFGFLAPLFIKRNKVWQILIYAIITSILIEVLQVLLGVGTGDIDDVILNAVGALIGFGVYKLIYSVALKNSLD